MSNLQRDIVNNARRLSREWLEKLITKKLEQAGVPAKSDLVKGLTDHILSKQDGEFAWKDGENGEDQKRKISLAITKDDLDALDRFTARLLDAIPAVAKDLSIKVADDVFRDLKARWPAQGAIEAAMHHAFQERLEARWGAAFDYLRMLHAMSLELGAAAFKRHRRSKGKGPAYMRGALIRLHARACQVTGEVMVLMESGHADGAMARWRTLHEIMVVALLISDFGDEIARRYIDYEAVEAKRALDMHVTMMPVTGHKPFSKNASRKIQRDYNGVLKKYGKEFTEKNGWAAHHLKKRAPTFDKLQEAAGRSASRSQYKLASYNVHADIKGISFRLGLMSNPGILAGASNAGLEEPGYSTAYSLAQMTVLILGPRPSIEQVATMRVLIRLRDEAAKAFVRAADRLRQDEKVNRTTKSKPK